MIIGDPVSKTVCYATICEKETGSTGNKTISHYIAYGRITLNACFVDLSIHQNPLTFLNRPDKYSTTFDSHQRGMFTLEGSIDNILSHKIYRVFGEKGGI